MGEEVLGLLPLDNYFISILILGDEFMDQRQVKKGIFIGVFAYIIWGLLPMYWKALDVVRADVVFAHRIVWSFFFIFIYIVVTKRLKPFFTELKRIVAHKKVLFAIVAASIIIGTNWLVFIWAVQSNYVIQASLGYYINPLMNVLLGVIILKERLSRIQQISVVLATLGVLYLTISYQVFPWISIILATTFAIYGLFKKIANLDATFSLMIETAVLTPVAFIYLFWQFGGSFGFQSMTSTNLLLISTGVATAVPLLLFGIAILHIPLSLTGFLQYIAPTLMLIIGVLLYKEPFTTDHLITFIFIWASVALYLASTLKREKVRLKK